jgi:2'-5' RNA ligase
MDYYYWGASHFFSLKCYNQDCMDQYVIIVVPPKEIITKVDKYRKRYAKYTKYNIPPHITIYPPFFNLLPSEEILINNLQKSLGSKKPTQVNLLSINFFDGRNNVVYFEPDQNSSKFLLDLLLSVRKNLKNKIKNVFRNYNFSPEKFKPHMTIAEMIPKGIFMKIKREIQNVKVNYSFSVDSVFLYRLQNMPNVWVKVCEVKFDKKI